MRPSIVSSLYGRERELRVVAGLIGGLAEGTGGVLVVRGEAGIGKSALLAAAAGLAADSGARMLSATGIQAEARLPFAGCTSCSGPSCPDTADAGVAPVSNG